MPDEVIHLFAKCWKNGYLDERAGRTRVVRTVGDSLGGYLPEMYETVIAEHEKMMVAFERRDPIAAGEAVFDHVTAARDRLLLRMARNGLFSEPATAQAQ